MAKNFKQSRSRAWFEISEAISNAINTVALNSKHFDEHDKNLCVLLNMLLGDAWDNANKKLNKIRRHFA